MFIGREKASGVLEGKLELVYISKFRYNEKKYAKSLPEKGIPAERIRKYGFAFEGKKVLLG